ncbi:MAG TPA: hypothetical protein VL523_12980 [Terriglobia bacterium]|nr:hypothetical protein [Terriglobia bacterium]
MPVKILGVLPEGLDGLVRKVLRQTLDARTQEFVIHISRPHGDVVVHVREPFDKRLKFTGGAELEIARELQAILADIVDEECGSVTPP